MSSLRPRLLRNAAAAAWRQRWNLDALAQEPLQLLTVKRSASPSFMMVAEGRRDGLLPDRSAPPEEEEVTLSAAELVAAMRSAAPPHHYFTCPVESLAPALSESAAGWETILESPPLPGRPPWLQMWAASAGSFTQAHYDVADNYFVQCDGQKEFLLWPPSAADVLQARAARSCRGVIIVPTI